MPSICGLYLSLILKEQACSLGVLLDPSLLLDKQAAVSLEYLSSALAKEPAVAFPGEERSCDCGACSGDI